MEEQYYLVSPYDEDEKKQRYFFWMRESEDERWVQFVKGLWRPKHDGDIVKLCDKVEDTCLLDWSGTWLYRPESTAGWLTREGRFYGCPTYYHDQLAQYVMGIKASEAEEAGWVRVKDTKYYNCLKKLSPEQKNWLSAKGYKIYD